MVSLLLTISLVARNSSVYHQLPEQPGTHTRGGQIQMSVDAIRDIRLVQFVKEGTQPLFHGLLSLDCWQHDGP